MPTWFECYLHQVHLWVEALLHGLVETQRIVGVPQLKIFHLHKRRTSWYIDTLVIKRGGIFVTFLQINERLEIISCGQTDIAKCACTCLEEGWEWGTTSDESFWVQSCGEISVFTVPTPPFPSQVTFCEFYSNWRAGSQKGVRGASGRERADGARSLKRRAAACILCDKL